MVATRNIKASFNIELPMELIFNILSRVPVEPLVRFKSVCKSWHALIQNPNFIKTQLTTYGQNKLSLLYIDRDDHTQRFNFCLHSNGKTRSLRSNPNFLFKTRPRVIGICNGLVCAVLDISEFIICNPTIGWLRKVPKSNLPLTRWDSEFLGFVFQDNDYKLCRIFYPCVCEGETLTVHAEVYSMNLDAWSNVDVKNVEVDILLNMNKFFWCPPDHWSTPLAINEVLYWVTCVDYDKFSYVAYFDMKRNVFGLIPLPGRDLTHACLQLVDLKGKLGLIIVILTWFELWVFNEKERSWTMMRMTKVFPKIRGCSLNCVGRDKDDKLVMIGTWPGGKLTTFLYDQETHDIIRLPFSWRPTCPTFKYLYIESLLSFDEEKIEDTNYSQGRRDSI